MNIYQNGAFSEILHKLTKYQALAASAKDFSKQNLYSQKIQEYRNRLDKMNFAQSGGVLSQDQEQRKSNLVTIIGKLLPENFTQNYLALKKSHDDVLNSLRNLKPQVMILIQQKRTIDAQQVEYEKQLINLRKTNTDLDNKLKERDSLEKEIAILKEQVRQKGIAEATDTYRIEELERQLRNKQKYVIQYIPNEELRLQLNVTTSENGRLQGELNEVRKELAQLKAKGQVSTNCDAEITEILNAIDGAVSTVNQKPVADESSQISELQSLVKTMVNNFETRNDSTV